MIHFPNRIEVSSLFNYFMDSYNDFKVEDFLENPSFRHWVYGKATQSEENFWVAFLLRYPEAEDAISQAKHLLQALTEQEIELSDAYIKERSNEIISQLAPETPVYQLRWWRWNIAVAVFVALGAIAVSWIYWKSQRPVKAEWAHVTTPVEKDKKGWEIVRNTSQRTKLVLLPDGSSLLLQPKSQIEFPTIFQADKREVTLKGEGFFEVKKNKKQPFYVYANEVITKVTGTSFNIRAFDTDEEVKVTVKTGSVAVYKKEQSQTPSLIVLPKQQATFERQDYSLHLKNITLPELSSLEKETFSYVHTPIKEVFEKLSKTYGVAFQYDSEALKYCSLTAVLDDRPLQEKLNLICTAIEAKYEYRNGEVAIYGKGCTKP
ncbi:FecR family protein [Siphonobacter sp. SORGH_AS_1065]|uniref:FecR family protein n=1 Tax=Siphonobacter sp. SORGH_AS_1065 TaxID=3041795 RepID=UPI00277D84ED|nr:FecR family protein [Siphonobacter sp. SORGH_AS_1065]MDQ1086497.1 transmembrane sensor [Siphonobacter sp. SORGH_AS_1065]